MKKFSVLILILALFTPARRGPVTYLRRARALRPISEKD
ncbi:hypothetical protein SDC9_185093 [bioreactor metagenome]|uniref:Uncharacterized protein n=1 Tax=bioreactor metagenome TaxID=1076179 RepID=A0A645HQD2_9ZZZZ